VINHTHEAACARRLADKYGLAHRVIAVILLLFFFFFLVILLISTGVFVCTLLVDTLAAGRGCGGATASTLDDCLVTCAATVIEKGVVLLLEGLGLHPLVDAAIASRRRA